MNYSFEAPANGLRGRATTGILKTGISQAVRLLVQFASVIVLSRLLLPSQFGLLAMAGPIVGFALLFQDLGLTQAVVQKPQLTQAEVSALFYISLGMSLGIAALLVAFAPVVSWFYGERQVGLLTAAMGVNVVLSGAGALHYALLNRRMQFGILAIIDASSALGGLAASVGFALLYRSFWALYLGSIVAILIPTVAYWFTTGWYPSIPRRRSGVGAALNFGANITGFNVVNFFSRNMDNVLIGNVWGEQPLGLYDRAYKLMLMPLQQINNPLAKVMLPVLSQMTSEPSRYRNAFLRTLAQMLLITLPGIAFMVGTADLIIPILLGRQWVGASLIFQALGMASFLQVLNNPTGWLFISQHRTREYMYIGVFSSFTAIISFLVGLPYGPLGVAVAYAIGEYIRTPVLWWYVTRRGPIHRGDVLRMAMPHYLGAIASLGAIVVVREVLHPALYVNVVTCLSASFLASFIMVSTFSHGRATIGQAAALARRALRRG